MNAPRRVPEKGEEATLTVVEESSGETVTLTGTIDHATKSRSRVYDGPDDETGYLKPGISGYVDVDGRRISFNTASDRVTEHHPDAEDPADSITFIGALVGAGFEGDSDGGDGR